jgi:quinol monooxygenase YgiN
VLVIAGEITVAANVRTQMLQAVAPHVADTRGEDGCIAYSLSADPVEADRVLVLEIWASVEQLAAHLGGPTIIAMGAAIGPFKPRGGNLTKYRVDASAPLYGSDGKPSFEFD